jgi:iron complex transport system permease protein
MGVMALSEHVASSLGQRARPTKFFAATVVLLLAGGAVSLAGAIGFVGLMTPHLVRAFVGWDYRVLIPSAALFGSLLVLVADIGARLLSAPFNAPVPVSVVTSLIGVPFFIYLISRRQIGAGGRHF